MTSVPPNNDDQDETTPPARSPSTSPSPTTSSAADAGSTSAAPASESGSSQGATSGDAAAAEATPASTSAPSTTSATEAGDNSAAPAPAPGRSSHAAPRPIPGTEADAGDSATHRLPTEEEDEALRAERERRFGRVAGSPATGEAATEQTTANEAATEPAEPAPESAPDTGREPTSMEPQTTAFTPPVPAQQPEDPFADFDDGPTSRAAAHWWGILIAIVFGPVTWYLLADGGERVSYALSQNLDAINVLGLVELGGGLVTLIIMLMAARWSSVGSIIIGSIGALIGAAFVVIPGIVADFLTSQSMIFDRLGQFGTNVFDHLTADGHSGRLLAYGVAFIFIGIVSHGARRQGRREERRKIALGE